MIPLKCPKPYDRCETRKEQNKGNNRPRSFSFLATCNDERQFTNVYEDNENRGIKTIQWDKGTRIHGSIKEETNNKGIYLLRRVGFPNFLSTRGPKYPY